MSAKTVKKYNIQIFLLYIFSIFVVPYYYNVIASTKCVAIHNKEIL